MIKDIKQITPIVELLGEKRVEKLKGQICEEIEKKLKKMHRDKLLEIATNAIDKLKND